MVSFSAAYSVASAVCKFGYAAGGAAIGAAAGYVADKLSKSSAPIHESDRETGLKAFGYSLTTISAGLTSVSYNTAPRESSNYTAVVGLAMTVAGLFAIYAANLIEKLESSPVETFPEGNVTVVQPVNPAKPGTVAKVPALSARAKRTAAQASRNKTL